MCKVAWGDKETWPNPLFGWMENRTGGLNVKHKQVSLGFAWVCSGWLGMARAGSWGIADRWNGKNRRWMRDSMGQICTLTRTRYIIRNISDIFNGIGWCTSCIFYEYIRIVNGICQCKCLRFDLMHGLKVIILICIYYSYLDLEYIYVF